jgi:hypothetical protein
VRISSLAAGCRFSQISEGSGKEGPGSSRDSNFGVIYALFDSPFRGPFFGHSKFQNFFGPMGPMRSSREGVNAYKKSLGTGNERYSYKPKMRCLLPPEQVAISEKETHSSAHMIPWSALSSIPPAGLSSMASPHAFMALLNLEGLCGRHRGLWRILSREEYKVLQDENRGGPPCVKNAGVFVRRN